MTLCDTYYPANNKNDSLTERHVRFERETILPIISRTVSGLKGVQVPENGMESKVYIDTRNGYGIIEQCSAKN